MSSQFIILTLVVSGLIGYIMHKIIARFIKPRQSVAHLFLYLFAHFISIFLVIFVVALGLITLFKNNMH